jgi:GNAT superfamily N-acetyltransferase
MNNGVTIRVAAEKDRDFILGLSPRLAEVAGVKWHTEHVVQKMQDDYIREVLDRKTLDHVTLIAEKNGCSLGFIHVCAHEDSISGEACGTIPLLAVSPETQGMGVGQILMKAAEVWAKDQGYRLLHLEVFANNSKARGFYQNLGFESETLHMIKTL